MADPELDYGELLKAVRRVGYDVYREAVYISVPGARPDDAATVERAETLLLRGRLVVRATRSGTHTYLAEVMGLVTSGRSSRGWPWR